MEEDNNRNDGGAAKTTKMSLQLWDTGTTSKPNDARYDKAEIGIVPSYSYSWSRALSSQLAFDSIARSGVYADTPSISPTGPGSSLLSR